MIDDKRKLSEISNIFQLSPQILKNVRFNKNNNPLNNTEFQNIIQNEEKIIAGKGRILVRKSGTENLIRIMVEGEDEKVIIKIADRIAKHIEI